MNEMKRSLRRRRLTKRLVTISQQMRMVLALKMMTKMCCRGPPSTLMTGAAKAAAARSLSSQPLEVWELRQKEREAQRRQALHHQSQSRGALLRRLAASRRISSKWQRLFYRLESMCRKTLCASSWRRAPWRRVAWRRAALPFSSATFKASQRCASASTAPIKSQSC